MASSNSNNGRKQQQPIDQGRKRRDASVTRQNVNNMNRNLPFADLGLHRRKSATTATSSSKKNNGRSPTSSSVISAYQTNSPSGRGGGSRTGKAVVLGRKQPQLQQDSTSELKTGEVGMSPSPKADNPDDVGLQPQQEVIDPKKWGTSVSKAFLRRELLKPDSIYWKMKPKDAYDSRKDLFSPFKYTNFVTNFRNLKGAIKGEIEAISFDDMAVKKEQAAFPLSEVDSRGNKRYHNHPARQLLADDIKNGAGKTYLNRPRDLRKTRNEYLEFSPEYFRKQFNRQKQREIEEVGWQHRRNVKGAKKNLARLDRLENTE